MIDHTGIFVTNWIATRDFYDAAFAPLGHSLLVQFSEESTGKGKVAGYGAGKPDFWLIEAKEAGPGRHYAFVAGTREAVDAFHAAALAAGGTDNGAPGLRPHYHEGYYGAFVIDPDGNNVEAVCHGG